ncbi:Transcription elongation factor B (SIII), polypeptide 1 (15kDa, elongin C) [Chamberlinius hualienensis]
MSDTMEKNCTCVGPDSKFVQLVSSDEYVFIVPRKCAILSETITKMLKNPDMNLPDEVQLLKLDIKSRILHHVCLFLLYAMYYKNKSTYDIPNFDIEDEILDELHSAAALLHC